jgi:hypothetical protein
VSFWFSHFVRGFVHHIVLTVGFECSFVEFCKLDSHFSKCCRRNFFSPFFLFDRAELVLWNCSIKINNFINPFGEKWLSMFSKQLVWSPIFHILFFWLSAEPATTVLIPMLDTSTVRQIDFLGENDIPKTHVPEASYDQP